jgi:hypothetical protein
MKIRHFIILIIPILAYSSSPSNLFLPGYNFPELKKIEIEKDSVASFVADSKVFSECVKIDRVKSDTSSHFYYYFRGVHILCLMTSAMKPLIH